MSAVVGMARVSRGIKDFAFVRRKEVLMWHLLKVMISIRSKMHAEEKVKDTLWRGVKNVEILQVQTALPVTLVVLLCRCVEHPIRRYGHRESSIN